MEVVLYKSDGNLEVAGQRIPKDDFLGKFLMDGWSAC